MSIRRLTNEKTWRRFRIASEVGKAIPPERRKNKRKEINSQVSNRTVNVSGMDANLQQT
jgi:hypothetical protein